MRSMAGNPVNKGITLRLSFEDFILIPLFIVLIFLSLRICFKKLIRTRRKDSYKCPNKNCIRCKGVLMTKTELVAKLSQFIEKENARNDDISRVRASILQDGNENSDSKVSLQSPTVLYLQNVSKKPIHTVSHDVSDILGTPLNINKIKDELKEVIGKDYLWSCNEVDNGCWKLYYFYNQGKKQNLNCINCPETAQMISQLASFMANVSFGNAAFSYLSQGTTIAAHCGPTNVRLRCHITLQTGNDCTLFVGNEKVTYQEGQCILFDDSYEHRVVHEKGAGGSRIILMLDLWHPDVTGVERKVIEHLFK